VLSVAWAGHKHFIVQTTAEGLYRFEGPAFPTVEELIAHQQECGLPVTTKSGAILKRSVPRETWELNNDDVELVEKIGSVSVCLNLNEILAFEVTYTFNRVILAMSIGLDCDILGFWQPLKRAAIHFLTNKKRNFCKKVVY
jgi:hypothetical protein